LKGENFTPFTLNEQLDEVRSILIDKRENIWFGTKANGAFRYDGENLVNYTLDDGLASNVVYEICQDRNGFLWFADDSDGAAGLSRYDGKTFTNFTTRDGLAHDRVSTIMEDSHGALWVGTRGGVSKYEKPLRPSATLRDGKTFTNLTEADGLVGNDVYSIIEDRDGNLWFGTNRGVSRYDGEKFTSFTTNDGFIGNGIDNIFEDSEGNIWFSSVWGPGVYDGKTLINFTTQDGLSSTWINTVFEDREGNLWFGHNGGGGLSKFSRRWRNYGLQDGLTGTFFKGLVSQGFVNVVSSIAEDHHGNLWIVVDGGVSKYDGTIFTQPISESKRLLGFVFIILEDSKHNIWFGTACGLVRYDGTDYTRFTTLDGLVGNIIDCMIEDRNGILWTGTRNSGISRYDGVTFTNFTSDDGLVDDTVPSIFVDTEGQIWIGTLNGLSKYNGRSFTTLPQLAGKFIWAIIEDKDGYLWLGTLGGGVIKTDGNTFTNITKADGLPGNGVRALQEDKDGQIWIGTGEGLTRYIPNPIAPLIHIESIVADRVYTNPKTISLPAGIGSLRINYRGISFRTRPEAMQYLYQLQGYDNDWQEPTNKRSRA